MNKPKLSYFAFIFTIIPLLNSLFMLRVFRRSIDIEPYGWGTFSGLKTLIIQYVPHIRQVEQLAVKTDQITNWQFLLGNFTFWVAIEMAVAVILIANAILYFAAGFSTRSWNTYVDNYYHTAFKPSLIYKVIGIYVLGIALCFIPLLGTIKLSADWQQSLWLIEDRLMLDINSIACIIMLSTLLIASVRSVVSYNKAKKVAILPAAFMTVQPEPVIQVIDGAKE